MKSDPFKADLNDLFKVLAEGKKQTKKEFDDLVSDSFDNLFWQPLVEDKQKPKKIKKKKYIKEDLEPVVEQKETLIERTLGLLTDPSDKKIQNDPLSPLDQKFATLEDLQNHYRLFISRIQQQLSTLGGGGETNLAYMDFPIKSVSSSSYNIRYDDYYIGVNYAGAVSLFLPKADREGKKYVVKDELGEASKGTNRYITIFPNTGDLIDGRDRAILAYDYGSLTFIWKSNSWRII